MVNNGVLILTYSDSYRKKNYTRRKKMLTSL